MTEAPSARSRLLLLAAWLVFGLCAWLVDWAGSRFDLAALRILGGLALACWVLLGAGALFRIVWRRLFWSAGRRLAFSYVLVGVLPLVLVATIVLVSAYLLAGFLLGHLARDAVASLQDRLEVAALAHLGGEPEEADLELGGGTVRFAEYRRGRRVGEAAEAPETWPDWLHATPEQGDGGDRRAFLALRDGRLSLAGVAGDGDRGVLAWLEGDLQRALRERTRAWFELYRSDDPRKLPVTRIEVLGRVLLLRGIWEVRDPAEVAEFYRLDPPATPGDPTWLERPLVLWMEQTGTLRALADGSPVADGVSISLASSPSGLFRSLLSTSESTDSTAWLALAGFGVLLLEIWMVAAAVAVFMIFGLSRAVNRLSRGTAAVARGDFSVRIPARRRDQIGDLQRSFNAMAEHLGELVETAAQKEAIDKELALARQVQEDLLPAEISDYAAVEIATFFEPSSAIGGDYFDVLERPDGGLAIVVADVAGHGLAAGLRMAMVKSALEILVADGLPAEQVLSRLHDLVRRRTRDRAFVTLTFADLDLASGRIELTNAGHPPCYLARSSGTVEEIVVPGLPLGSLDGRPGRRAIRLDPGETVLFLSDGLFECRNRDGEPFGFERLRESLEGAPAGAAQLLERLLQAVRRHCGTEAVEDDRTVVALSYRGSPAAGTMPSRS